MLKLTNIVKTYDVGTNQVKALMETDYPLTLVTCTLGGRTRVTARCIKVEEQPAVPQGMTLSMEWVTE